MKGLIVLKDMCNLTSISDTLLSGGFAASVCVGASSAELGCRSVEKNDG